MKRIIASIVLVSLIGCAHTVAPNAAVSKDKDIAVSTAVSDTGVTGMTTTANKVTFKMTNPATGRQEEKEVVYVTHSTPLGRELLTVGLGAVTPALIYRNAIMNAGCKSNCAPVLTSIAGAEAANQAVSNVGVNVGTGLGKYGK